MRREREPPPLSSPLTHILKISPFALKENKVRAIYAGYTHPSTYKLLKPSETGAGITPFSGQTHLMYIVLYLAQKQREVKYTV